MKSIIDDTIDVLSTMGLKAIRVSTPPGFEGIQVGLPEGILNLSKPEVGFLVVYEKGESLFVRSYFG
jgi:hypothetical protein